MVCSKTVVVTGGSRGIGQSICELFAHNNYNVVINYNTSEEQALELYNKLTTENCSVRMFKADVSKGEDAKALIAYCIQEFSTIDVLINNAGIAQTKLFTDIIEHEWDKMIDTNLKSVFLCTQNAVKHMLKLKKGKIINISSIWGMVGASCEVHYSTAKAGIIGFTKALAKELGPSNIQVNCIAPGVIKTDMLSEYTEDEMMYLKDNTPLMRIGNPEDIASCALYLASSSADFITGQVISPNGGFVI